MRVDSPEGILKFYLRKSPERNFTFPVYMDDMNDRKHFSGLTLAIHFVSAVHVLRH